MTAGWLARVARARAAGRPLAVATVVHAQGEPVAVGTRLVVDEDGVEGTLGHPELDRLVTADARRLLGSGVSRSFLYRCGASDGVPVVRDRRAVVERRREAGFVQVYIETFVPPPVLLIFGAGHDAIPVTELGARAGFRVVVVDSRPAYARPERFPRAHQVIHAHPEDVPARVPLDRRTYTVVMTHNFLQDAAILQHLCEAPCPYVGVLGPWERTEKILASLRREGRFVEPLLEKLYAPVGLDIGAEGPEQIALAVVAEVLAVHRGAGGGFLRFRQGPLHRAGRTGDEVDG